MAGMARTDALAFLAGVYAQQLSEAGMMPVDDAANLKSVIDEALLTLGTAYDDLATATVEGDDVRGYRTLLRYFGLARIHDAVVDRVDIQGGSPNASKNRSQYVRQLAARLDDLRKEAANYGLATGPSWQAPATLSGDWIEPAVTA